MIGLFITESSKIKKQLCDCLHEPNAKPKVGEWIYISHRYCAFNDAVITVDFTIIAYLNF